MAFGPLSTYVGWIFPFEDLTNDHLVIESATRIGNKRTGTAAQVAAPDVYDGEIAGCVTNSTWYKNFVDFLRDLIRQTPEGLNLHFIADNLLARKTPAVQDFLMNSPTLTSTTRHPRHSP